MSEQDGNTWGMGFDIALGAGMGTALGAAFGEGLGIALWAANRGTS